MKARTFPNAPALKLLHSDQYMPAPFLQASYVYYARLYYTGRIPEWQYQMN